MPGMPSIVELSDRIAAAFRPERLILFGSHADGRSTEDSVVDLLVIMQYEGTGARQPAEILGNSEPAFPVDLIVRTPEQIVRRLEWQDFFLKDILEKGRVLCATDHP